MAMVRDVKTRREVEAVDRISKLPTNLIDIILEYLPTHDAARTSVLSKPWRNIWGMHPRLYLDESFFVQLVTQKFSGLDEQTRIIEVSRTISNILLAHNGPILNFFLCIPNHLPFHQSADMVLWIKNLSNSGVRELKLQNESLHACTLPSHFFSCSHLTRLSLTNCVLNPPLGFEGFCNLIRVKLVYVQINTDMSFGAQLKELVMELCTGIEHLGSQFKCENNLFMLSIVESEGIDWQWFECTQKLQVLTLMLDEVPSSSKEMITLDKLVSNMPRITSLFLDGLFLKISKPGSTIPKRLTRAMENLKILNLHCIELLDLVQIQHVFCLIRSAPNLKVLIFELVQKTPYEIWTDKRQSMNFMKVWGCEAFVKRQDHEVQSSDGMNLLDRTVLSDHMILDRLETLRMYDLVGSRSEFQFIKFLLASSPSLKRIELEMDTIVDDPTEALRISQEMLQISRASKSAQIQWM